MSHKLHVVAPISNHLGWLSRDSHYRNFERHMLESGVDLTTVECAYGDRPFKFNTNPAVRHVGVRANTVSWNKENLINIGISRLPHDWKYVAWIDADIQFRRSDWVAKTIDALQFYHFVQPWSDCYDLGPNDEHIEQHRSFGRVFFERQPIMQGPKCGPNTYYRFAHPGYAWAATRQGLEWTGGLIETAVLGAADHHMALGLIGRAEESYPGNISQGYKDPILTWQKRATTHIPTSHVSYVPGTIEHFWHGPKNHRRYVERWGVLIKNDFNPATDLKKNVFGVVELAGNKPELAHDIDVYFRSRLEDLNAAI